MTDPLVGDHRSPGADRSGGSGRSGGSDRSGWGDLRPALGRALFGDHLRSSLTGRGGGVLWLVFVVIPIISAVSRRGPALERGLVIAGAVAFVVTYMVLVVNWRRRRSQATSAALFAVLISLATAMTLGDRPGWGFLFIYCAACAALFLPPFGLCGVVLCSVLAAVTSALSGGGAGTGIGVAASSAGVGLMMLILRDLRVRNEELSQARAELARLAVARERERFARDLHDLLGHTLSVIALKTELAGRLLPDRPRGARREIADVEEVARNALSEVREAVSGYRRPKLDSELAGARLALSAAGIATDVERAEVALDPAVEAVLSWAVREGTTNVIRHSGATQCRVRVRVSSEEASVEIVDNGRGAGAATGSGAGRATGTGAGAGVGAGAATGAGAGAATRGGAVAPSGGWAGVANGRVASGTGLQGLAERARTVRGRVDAGPLDRGGFRLAVSVPTSANALVSP